MKKIIICGIFATLAVAAQGTEIDLSETVTREWGMSGLEFTGNYTNVNRKNESKADKLKDIYSMIENTNNYLSNELSKDTFDKDYLLKFNYNYLRAEDLKAPGFNLTFAGFYDESNRIGVNVTYTDIKSKLVDMDTDGEGYQLSLFWLNSDIFDNSSSFINIYYGTTKEDIDDINDEYKTNYYGAYGKIEKLYEGFNDFSKGYNVELEAKKIEDEIGERDEKNTSATVATNGIIQKIFFVGDDSTVTLKATAGYKREFLEDRKYHEIMDDEYRDSLNAAVQLDLKVAEVLDIYSKFEVKKSLNTSDNENRVMLGFKLSI